MVEQPGELDSAPDKSPGEQFVLSHVRNDQRPAKILSDPMVAVTQREPVAADPPRRSASETGVRRLQLQAVVVPRLERIKTFYSRKKNSRDTKPLFLLCFLRLFAAMKFF